MTTFVSRHPVVSGALGGALWGVVMRAWMRFITTSPEFSWSGTLFIVGGTTIVGTLLAVARVRRIRGGKGWWRLNGLSLGLLGAGGAVMWPGVVLGAAALGWRADRRVRTLLALAAAASQVSLVGVTIWDNWRMSGVAKITAAVWYVPMLLIEIWAFSIIFRPVVEGVAVPRAMRGVLVGVTSVALCGVAVLTVGIAGA